MYVLPDFSIGQILKVFLLGQAARDVGHLKEPLKLRKRPQFAGTAAVFIDLMFDPSSS